MHFDLENLNYVTPQEAANRIESGWLAQFRGHSYLSTAIEYSTGGVHSHSAMLRCDYHGVVDVLEVRIGGGRAVAFEDVAIEDSGLIDVFSIDKKRFPEYDGPGACDYMRRLTAKNYGYGCVLRLGMMRCPLLWRMFSFDVGDEESYDKAPFCSHAVCSAMRIGGGIDPVPRKPDFETTPNDLTRSLLFNYEFTVRIPSLKELP